MKAIIGRAVAAVVLVAGGWLCWTAANLERRLAEANRQVATLQYAAPIAEYDAIEQSLGLLGRVPWMAADLATGVRQRRAAAQYWQANYATFSLERDMTGQLVESDPDILFLAANATYRATQRPSAGRQADTRALETVMANYADVLKRQPGHEDAAYNYEFLVRARDLVTRSRQPRGRPGQTRQADADTERPTGGPSPDGPESRTAASDLPTGPTIHGQPGGPPPGTDMSEFKMLVPMRPEERTEDPTEAGVGGKKVRRG